VRGLIFPGSRRTLASNRLVMIMSIQRTPLDGISALRLPGVSRLAIGQPDIVPAGKYAYQVLEREGVLPDISEKLVYTKDVQQVLVYVRAGSVDAGFVYASDVFASTPVRVIRTVPDSMHAPILYEGVMIKRPEGSSAAAGFLAYLVSDSVQALFQMHGFLPVPK